jgi:hypothetical protein
VGVLVRGASPPESFLPLSDFVIPFSLNRFSLCEERRDAADTFIDQIARYNTVIAQISIQNTS